MSYPKNNKICSLKFDVCYNNQSKANGLQDKIISDFNTHIHHICDALFNKYFGNGHYKLPQLELNLGNLTESDIKHNLPVIFKEKLENILSQVKVETQHPKIQEKLTHVIFEDTLFEYLKAYFSTGIIPWNLQEFNQKNIAYWLEQTYSLPSEKSLTLVSLAKNTDYRIRFVRALLQTNINNTFKALLDKKAYNNYTKLGLILFDAPELSRLSSQQKLNLLLGIISNNLSWFHLQLSEQKLIKYTSQALYSTSDTILLDYYKTVISLPFSSVRSNTRSLLHELKQNYISTLEEKTPYTGTNSITGYKVSEKELISFVTHNYNDFSKEIIAMYFNLSNVPGKYFSPSQSDKINNLIRGTFIMSLKYHPNHFKKPQWITDLKNELFLLFNTLPHKASKTTTVKQPFNQLAKTISTIVDTENSSVQKNTKNTEKDLLFDAHSTNEHTNSEKIIDKEKESSDLGTDNKRTLTEQNSKKGKSQSYNTQQNAELHSKNTKEESSPNRSIKDNESVAENVDHRYKAKGTTSEDSTTNTSLTIHNKEKVEKGIYTYNPQSKVLHDVAKPDIEPHKHGFITSNTDTLGINTQDFFPIDEGQYYLSKTQTFHIIETFFTINYEAVLNTMGYTINQVENMLIWAHKHHNSALSGLVYKTMDKTPLVIVYTIKQLLPASTFNLLNINNTQLYLSKREVLFNDFIQQPEIIARYTAQSILTDLASEIILHIKTNRESIKQKYSLKQIETAIKETSPLFDSIQQETIYTLLTNKKNVKALKTTETTPSYFYNLLLRLFSGLTTKKELPSIAEQVEQKVKKQDTEFGWFLISLSKEKRQKIKEIIKPHTAKNIDQLLQSFTNKTQAKLLSNTNSSLPDEDKSKYLIDVEKNKTMFISNAGIILLAPYIKMLFSKLELITVNGFENKVDQTKAVQLLYYLATGHTHPEEPEIILHKIISGLMPSQTLQNLQAISPKEKELCDSLLNAVIKNWGVLKNTSIETLRATFLMRNAKLNFEEKQWRLQIESHSLDILLDKLPWSFTTIKYTWMEIPIISEWR